MNHKTGGGATERSSSSPSCLCTCSWILPPADEIATGGFLLAERSNTYAQRTPADTEFGFNVCSRTRCLVLYLAADTSPAPFHRCASPFPKWKIGPRGALLPWDLPTVGLAGDKQQGPWNFVSTWDPRLVHCERDIYVVSSNIAFWRDNFRCFFFAFSSMQCILHYALVCKIQGC